MVIVNHVEDKCHNHNSSPSLILEDHWPLWLGVMVEWARLIGAIQHFIQCINNATLIVSTQTQVLPQATNERSYVFRTDSRYIFFERKNDKKSLCTRGLSLANMQSITHAMKMLYLVTTLTLTVHNWIYQMMMLTHGL